MSGSSKIRLQEGALSALRTPESLPERSRLVPSAGSVPSSVGESGPPPADDGEASVQRGLNSRLVQHAVTQAQEGDPEGLHFLYARYSPDVQRFVVSLVKDQHEAEDITQNVFAKLMVGIKKYNARDVPFAAWILRVARNAALDHMRAKRAISVERVPVVDVYEESSDESLVRGRDLRQALEQLPDDQREVLILRHIAGLSPVEIAATLGQSESTVSGLHHRGRRALSTILTQLSQQQHALEEIIQE